MKKLGMLLALTAFILSFNSCSKDDDDFSLVGTWQQEKFEFRVSFGVPGLQDMVETDTDPTTFVFNSDGTGSATYEEENVEITDTFSWNLSGNELTITDSEMTLTLELTTMTNTKVVGEQSLTIDQLAAMADLDEEELEGFALFPNLTADLIISLVK
jgi:hypothetical protein